VEKKGKNKSGDGTSIGREKKDRGVVREGTNVIGKRERKTTKGIRRRKKKMETTNLLGFEGRRGRSNQTIGACGKERGDKKAETKRDGRSSIGEHKRELRIESKRQKGRENCGNEFSGERKKED